MAQTSPFSSTLPVLPVLLPEVPAILSSGPSFLLRAGKKYDPAGKFFTYAIESSSIYCMPEIESRVHIYFPEHDEQSAIAVHAIGSGSGSGGGQNPDNKRFSDSGGSAMLYMTGG